jgi:autotransporter-associated beta strand protein
VAAVTLSLPAARGATAYFSYDGVDGAAESWTTGGTNWGTATGTWSGYGWVGYDQAVFEGTGGLVNASSILANTLTFNVGGYTLAGSVTFGNPGGNNLTVASNVSAAITGNLTAAYSTGLSKAGAGTAVLSGTNSVSVGALQIANGILEIAGGTTTSSAGLSVSRNAFGVNDAVLSTLRVTGGALNITGGSFFTGRSTNGGSNVSLASLIEQTGGSITYGGTAMNLADGGGVSRLDLSGGTFTSTSAGMLLGVRAGVTLNISGTALVTLPSIGYFHSDAVTGTGRTSTINLNGGTLVVGNISSNSTANTSNLVLNGGLLQARSNATINANLTSITVGSGGARFDTNGFDVTVGRAMTLVSGTSGGLTKSGAGTLTLQGINTYTGAVSVQAGTLLLTASTAANASGLGSGGSSNTVTVAQGATLRFASNNRTAGYHAANVFLNGGTITFDTSDNSFAASSTLTMGVAPGLINGSGQWRMRDGSNRLLVAAASSGSVVSVANLTLTTSGGNHTFEVADGAEATDLLVSSAIGSHFGNERLTKTGAGTMVFSGSNTIAGGVTISAGTLGFGTSGLGASGTVTLGSATLRWEASNTTDLSPRLALSNAASAVLDTGANDVTFATAFGASSTAALTKSGTGILSLNAANGYSGLTTVAAGTLRLGNAAALGSGASGTVVAAGATLDLFGQVGVTESLTLSGSLLSSAGSATHNAAVALASASQIGGAGDLALAGTLSGVGSLEKVEAGTLTLSGSAGHTGGTLVSAGRLIVTGSVGAVSVASAATFGGTGTVGAVTVSGAGAVEASAGTLTLSSLTLGGSSASRSVLRFAADGFGGVAGLVDVLGNLVLSGGTDSVSVDFGSSLASLARTEVAPYTLLTFGGTGPADLSAFRLTGTQGARQTATLVLDGGVLGLEVDNAFPIWRGSAGSGWSAADNWVLSTNGQATTFLANDAVLLDDTASSGVVDFSEDVVVSSLTFTSGTLDYTLQSSVGKGITAGSLAKSGAASLTVANANDFTLGVGSSAGAIFLNAAGALGSGAVVLTDTNLVLADGASTGSGAVSVTRGRVRLGSGASLGTAPLTLADTTLESDGSGARLVGNDIILLGSLSLGSEDRLGTLTLTGDLGLGGATRTLDVLADTTVSGDVGNGSLTKTGSATLALTGANALTGTVVVSAGKLTLATLGTAAAISSGAELEIINGASLTLSASLSGAGDFAKSGAGKLTLAGTNTLSGKVRVTGGTLSISADSRLGAAPASAVADQLTLDGGTLEVTAGGQTLSANRGITLGSSGGTLDNRASGTSSPLTLAGVISGAGPLVLWSTGNTSATGGADGGLGMRLTAANSFIGDVSIRSGHVAYASNAAFGDASNRIVLDGGGLLDSGVAANLARNLHVAAAGGFFRVYSNLTAEVSGALTGSGQLRRTDAGTLRLSGDLSAFAGSIIHQISQTTLLTGSAAGLGASASFGLAAGALEFAPGRLGSGTVQMSGGTLRWSSGNTEDVAARIQLQASATANLDTNGNNVSLGGGLGSAASSALAKNGSGILSLAAGSTSISLVQVNAGTLAVAGGTLVAGTDFSVRNASLSVSSGSVSASRLVTSDASGANSTLSLSGGLIEVVGTNNADSTSASFLLAHFSAPSVLNLSGGELRSLGANLTLGWDGQATVNHSGGVANLLGIRLGPTRNNTAAYNLTGGRLNLGANGVVSTGSNKTLAFGEATVGALANWSSAQGIVLTSVNGTTFDTLDAADGVTALTVTLSGAVSGVGRLVKAGSGTLVLGIANTFSGGTLVQAGTLRLANAGALGSAAATLSGGELDLAGLSVSTNITLSGGAFRGAGTLSGTLSGSGGLTKLGAGTLDLSGVPSFSGDLAVSGGSLAVTSSTVLGAGSFSGTISLASGTSLVFSTSADQLLSGGFSGAGSFSKSGSGILTLSGSGSAFSGAVMVTAGTLVVGHASALGSGTITVSGGVLDLNGFALDREITLSGGRLTGLANVSAAFLDLSSDTPAVSGSIAGILNLAGKTVDVTGGLTATGTLKGDGAIFSGGVVTLGSNATHAPGDSPGSQTFEAGLTYASSSTLEWEIDLESSNWDEFGLPVRGVNYDAIDVTGGDLTITAGAILSLGVIDIPGSGFADAFWDEMRQFSVISFTSSGQITGVFTLDTSNVAGLAAGRGQWSLLNDTSGISLQWTPVPEPSTYGLILGGLALAGAALRRRRSRA